jgi:hypothetical protein
MKKFQWAVVGLVVIQVLHSLEEIFLRFYDRFPLFRFYEGIFTSTAQGMFLAFNVSLWLMLILGSLLAFSKWWRIRFPLFFAVIEALNGLYHLSMTVFTMTYFPGVVSGLFYFPLSLYIFMHYREWKETCSSNNKQKSTG